LRLSLPRILLLALAAVLPCEAQTIATTLMDPNASFPFGIAINETTSTVYVANRASNNITVINGASNSFTTVADPSALDPVALAINPVTNKVYIANDSSQSITVLDGATNSTTAIPTGHTVVAIAVNVTTNKIYAITAVQWSRTGN
jgi:DNA-binding beta-propeller fold protein YncE